MTLFVSSLSVVYTTSEIFPSREQVLAINQVIAQIERSKSLLTPKIFSDIGFKFLTEKGLNRVCYVSSNDRFVLKIDLQKQSEQNKTEIKTAKRLPKILRSVVLLPISYSTDYLWLVMPKAQTDLSTHELMRIQNKILNFLADHKYYCSDIHNENIGIFEGREVIFDYGFGFGKEK